MFGYLSRLSRKCLENENHYLPKHSFFTFSNLDIFARKMKSHLAQNCGFFIMGYPESVSKKLFHGDFEAEKNKRFKT